MELTNAQLAEVAGRLSRRTDQGEGILEEHLREAIQSVLGPDIFITADDLGIVRQWIQKNRSDLARALRGRVLLFGPVEATKPVLEVLEGEKDKTGGLVSTVDSPVVSLEKTDSGKNPPENTSKKEIPDFFHRYKPPVTPASRPVRPMGKVLRFIRK